MRALALVLPILLAACGRPTTPTTPTTPTSPTHALAGRIAAITAVDDPDRPHNVAFAATVSSTGTFALAPLWEADSEISDWQPSPDGRRALYREVWHYVPKTEALVVRDVAVGAAPRYVVMGEPELSRLAGQVWSPDGSMIAYGLQAGDVGAFSGSGGTRRWELRAVDVGAAGEGTDDRRLFVIDGASLGTHVYTLLAWSPAHARAALLETPGGGGSGAFAVRIHDTTDGHLVARVAPGGDDPVLAASPDGRWLAWLSAAAGVGTVDVITGAWRPIAPVEEDAVPFALAWSHDGRWLAWAAAMDSSAADGAAARPAGGRHVVVNAAQVAGWRGTARPRRASVSVDAADGGLGQIALSPRGDAVLLTDVAHGATDARGGRAVARVVRLARGWTGRWRGDGAIVSELAVPRGVWGIGWWR